MIPPPAPPIVDLDRAATTPLRPESRAAMAPFLAERYGNPSASHALGRDAMRAVDEAREQVADILGCTPAELLFTSGGTESDVHAVTGGLPVRPGRVLCSAVEHPAVLRTVLAIGGRTVAVRPDARIDLDALADALDPTVELVSVMAANNEVGTVNDIPAVAAVVAAHAPGAVLHTDAVQAAPWFDLRRLAAAADLVSVSAHKFGGPKGVGALVVRSGVELRPLLPGGGQEWGRRSGTTNVAGVVGMAAALRATAADREGTARRVGALRDRLVSGLCGVPGVRPTVPDDGTPVVPGICHLLIDDVDSEPLLFLLDSAGVRASASSACASGAAAASHVLAAIGADRGPDGRGSGALRLSLGHDTTEDHVERVLRVVPEVIDRLRSASPSAPTPTRTPTPAQGAAPAATAGI